MPNQVAHGFINMQHVFDQRLVDQNVQVVNDAVQQSVDEHNRQVDALVGLFAEITNEYKIVYRTPSASRNQPLDEQGRARKIAPAGQYEVAFPIHDSGSAWGQTFKALVKMTVEEANNATVSLLTGDLRWMRDHILAALLANASWTFPDDQHGNLTIMGLANGDTTIYQIASGADQGIAAHDHYVAQANAITDADDPFPADYENLFEHPENSGEAIAIVSTTLKSGIEGLAGFVPVANTRLSAASGQREILGELGVAVPGKVIGYHDAGVWIAEWRSMPSGYMATVATNGPRALWQRQEPEPELQGFRKTAERNDHPFYESQYERHAGFGAYNRVGAVIRRVGNAAYAVPAGYESPMA